MCLAGWMDNGVITVLLGVLDTVLVSVLASVLAGVLASVLDVKFLHLQIIEFQQIVIH